MGKGLRHPGKRCLVEEKRNLMPKNPWVPNPTKIPKSKPMAPMVDNATRIFGLQVGGGVGRDSFLPSTMFMH